MHKAIDNITKDIDHLLVDGHIFKPYIDNKEGEFVRGFGTQKKPEEIEEHIKAII